MAFHVGGSYDFLMLTSGSNTEFVFDVDTEQWMPPWSAQIKQIYSAETSPGNYVLLANQGNKVATWNPSTFADNTGNYNWVVKTNLFAVVPDFGKRFSYLAAGIYDEPSRTGYPDTVQIDSSANTILADVLILADDDPVFGTYTSIFSQSATTSTAFNRSSGTFIQQNVYKLTQPAARWIGLQFKGQSAPNNDLLYGWFLAYKNLGGR